jgi:hypothetical protein
MVFHVLNQGVRRKMLFTKDEDFLPFERVVEEPLRTRRMRRCACCLTANQQTEAEPEALRCCVNRGRPFGDPSRVADVARQSGP